MTNNNNMKDNKPIKSPIAYMGNKYTLINKLKELFPERITTFYDIFGGSGVMSINFGDVAIYNEIMKSTKDIVELSITNANDIIEQCEKWYEEFNLNNPKETSEQELQFKKDYNTFRDYINSLDKDSKEFIMGVYALHTKSMNNLIRYNKKGEFNASAGFIKSQKGSLSKLNNFIDFNKDIKFFSKDFEHMFDIIKEDTDKDILIYFDPPYLNTTAVYNEQRAGQNWDINEDYRLFKMIDKLSKLNIKWAYSNTLVGKNGVENTHIKEWVEKNNYYINYLNKTYQGFGHQNSKNMEVLITNYKNN